MLERVMGRFTQTDTDLNGQVSLITGESRGLGLLLARAFAAEGCKIAICSRDAGELAEGERDLEQRGAMVATVVCDITS
jgi:NAD(P)-dependent dehydrogenase (short-subunit alcohol dehydrogenase family)